MRSRAALVLGAVLAMACAATARAGDDPWASNSNWLSIRGGYAKNNAEGAGNGGAGYGFGVTHMLEPYRISDWKVMGRRPLGFLHWTLFKQFSIGGSVNYDVISRFGTASEVEVPATVELVRHFNWKTAPRPYVGFGFGPHFLKTYHTGSDNARVSVGGFLTTGANLPVASKQLLGFDIRVASVNNYYNPENPVFGIGQHTLTKVVTENFLGLPRQRFVYDDTALHWTVKCTYSLTY